MRNFLSLTGGVKMKKKYRINKEFFPLTLFRAPVGKAMVLASHYFMPVPRFLFKDPGLDVDVRTIPSFNNGTIRLYIISPKGASSALSGQLSRRRLYI